MSSSTRRSHGSRSAALTLNALGAIRTSRVRGRPRSRNLGLRRAVSVLVAAAVIACVGIGGTAQAAKKTPKGSGAPACGNAAAPNGALDTPAPPFDIKKFILDKGKAAAEQAGSLAAKVAFNYISSLTGLDQILPQSENAQILAQLKAIQASLDEVNSRLGDISTKVDQAISEARNDQLTNTMRSACTTSNQVKFLYLDYYVPVVEAGVILGDILSSNDPVVRAYATTRIGDLPPDLQDRYGNPNPCDESRDKAKQLGCLTPKTLVGRRQDLFAQEYDVRGISRTDTVLSNFLRPNTATGSVLTDFGAVLMEKPVIGHSDSVSMRELYTELAQAEAMSAWMQAEYHVLDTTGGVTRDTVYQRFATNTAAEQATLPPMIPEGAVIDLGGANAVTTRNHPIYMVPTTVDQTFWTPNVENNNTVSTTADGPAQIIGVLNSKSCDSPACFNHWRVPTRAQVGALLTRSCPGICVKGQTNIAGALTKLNPVDPVWTGVFCDRSVTPNSCGPSTQHNFIWTADAQQIQLRCGFFVNILVSVDYKRFYSRHFGIQTQSNLSSNSQVYPVLQDPIVGYTNDGSSGGDRAHTRCDDYARSQLFLPENKGIVMVTDNTGQAEFMAQK